MATLDFSHVIEDMGEAGLRMAHLGASEGGAGNISVFTRDLGKLDARFRFQSMVDLPVAAPALADGWVIVTGTGRRLRDVARYPDRTLAVVRVQPDGRRGMLYAAGPVRPTSEFNSHLLVHDDHAARRGIAYHALLHAQPMRLTYLSHHPAYPDTRALSQRLCRWEPEMLVVFPDGIGLLPFQVPASAEQQAVTVAGLRQHRAVVWQRHGIVTRSDDSVGAAADLVDYAETAASYEVLNLALGQPTEGLSDEQLHLIAERLAPQQTLF